ncbi:MAG: hypothetical protein ACRD4E_10235 [Bryobacteraceae bacterium]
MILTVFTLFHVVISLIAIGSGFVVVSGLLASKRPAGSTKLFWTTAVATTVTGFLFPFHGFTPGIGLGIISTFVLAIGLAALYRFGLAGSWRRTYAIAAVIALYLNMFVLVVQLFEKVPALKELAPTQYEPPFQIAQLVVLVIFAMLGVQTARKFRSEPMSPPKARSARA